MIENQLKQIIEEHLDIDINKIQSDSCFSDMGVDSLDALDLLRAINEAFDISIPAEKLTEIQTVQQMINAVRASIKHKRAG